MAKAKSSKRGDKDLDALYEGVMNCEAAIPPGDMDRLADMVFDKEHIVRTWRLTALLASKDGGFYRGVANDQEQAQTFAPVIDSLQEFAEMLRTVAGLADTVYCRLLVAGCNHADFNDWMKAAEAGEVSHG